MNMNRRQGLRQLVAASGVLGASSAIAQTAVVTKRDDAALSAIVEKLTGGKVEHIGVAPLPGLREVIVGNKVLYIDEAGELLVEGHIIDIANRRSLTAQRQAEYLIATTPTLRLQDLDLKDAITVVYGERKAGRELISFEDPRCGFCKRLHGQIKSSKDLTLHIFPVSFLGPESRTLNEYIWCSPSPSQAWLDAMEGKAVPKPVVQCSFDALERNMALADKYRIGGTPTLFTAHGQRFNGAVGLEVLESALT